MKVYIGIPKEQSEETVNSGIVMPGSATMQIKLQGAARPCLLAFMTPGDIQCDTEKYDIFSADVDAAKIPVAEGVFRKESIKLTGTGEFEKRIALEKMYYASFTALGTYRLGSYMEPECVITSSIPPENLRKTDANIDFAVFFDSSSKLHTDCLYGAIGENAYAKELAVRGYYDSMAEAGYAKKEIFGESAVYTLKDGSYVVLHLRNTQK